MAFSPENGTRPQAISYSMTPSAYTSVRPSVALPSACSGDMYAGVPNTAPAWVKRAWLTPNLAMPKSKIFTEIDVALALAQEDVVRLEIAMNDAGQVRRVQRFGDLHCNLRACARAAAATSPRSARPASAPRGTP